MKAVFFRQEETAASFWEEDIPEHLRDEAEHYHHAMIEAAADYDEALMDAYLNDEPLTPEQIVCGLRKGTLEGKLQPVLVGSALRNIGVRRLLDAITLYLPSPLERPAAAGFDRGDQTKPIQVVCDFEQPFVGLAFKIMADKHGDLYFIRIYRGTLKTGSRVLNVNRDRKENITRIFQMHANSRNILDAAYAGQIVAVVGLKDTLTGDTLCDARHRVMLESISFPETVISMSIEPKTAAEASES